MNDLYTAIMHDVKNQLAELALRLRKRGDARAEMEIAMNSSRRLSEMLLLSRENNDQLWINADTVNPADFLEILAAEYTELFPSIAIRVDVARAPACAFFDKALIRMAFGNALHNACRYARSHVQLAAFEQDNMLILEVCDDGPGFQENVLTSGGQLPAVVTGAGTGLGLYLANKIAGLHQLKDQHGHIELSNIVNESGKVNGGQFRMVLP
ncbi:MAG: HAMP domain-containing sensor histidine kinase [Gallionella sp.]|jgi:signal transduction histidine kinase